LTASSGTKLRRSDLLKVSYPASERSVSDLDAGEKFTFPALFHSGMRKQKAGTNPAGSDAAQRNPRGTTGRSEHLESETKFCGMCDG
jgi:hypothetical protein